MPLIVEPHPIYRQKLVFTISVHQKRTHIVADMTPIFYVLGLSYPFPAKTKKMCYIFSKLGYTPHTFLLMNNLIRQGKYVITKCAII